MHVDIHALQTVPYSNLNRDAIGSPKSCVYGGRTRTRVSSQSWKRAVRKIVEQELGETTLRTRRVAEAVAKTLRKRDWSDEDARKAGRAVMFAANSRAKRSDAKEGGIAPDPATDMSGVLFWIPTAAIAELADLCERHRDAIAATALPELDEKGKPKKTKEKADIVVPAAAVDEILALRSPTINLLGRMLAEIPGHGVDGATLFAHAFTTHETAMDLDFFTAVDDLPNGETGAGHLATAEFTSGVFYRYSSINIGHLARNMGGSVDEALTITDAYLRAFTTAIPGGKQNVTAATTRPDLVYLALRRDPLSLAAAFEKPVLPARDGGHAEPSRKRLNDYAGQLERFLGTGPLWSGYASVDTAEYTHLGTPAESLDTLIVNATTAASDQPIPVGAV